MGVVESGGGSHQPLQDAHPLLPFSSTVLSLWPCWLVLDILPPHPHPQDSQYPWSQRVSFAKDIASGMVSRL